MPNSFINPRTMDRIDMYIKLLEVFQGNNHKKDKAANATTEFKKLSVDVIIPNFHCEGFFHSFDIQFHTCLPVDIPCFE